jgi:RHS repeat-associated protein
VVNNATGEEKHIMYIGGSPYESNIVSIKDFKDTEASFKFLHKDYLGSILAISDDQGKALEYRHFDAWGLSSHIYDGSGNKLTQFAVLDRGYTSHEHLTDVGLIHMNGRLYDPILRRFLNADENIQDPENTQVYNKYGYVMNNPLMYADYNGEWFGLDDLVVAAVSFVVGYAMHAFTTGDFGWNAVKAGLQGAVMGWLAYNTCGIATAGSGLGSAASTTAMSNFLTNSFVNQVVATIIPPVNFSIGDFDFSISPSIALGKGWGIGANLSVTFHAGDFSISGGIGLMNWGSHSGSASSGFEFRKSVMIGYDDGKFGMSLGTNLWSGMHGQRTGMVAFRHGDWSMSYENDGSPFGGWAGDNNDSHRTAGARFNYKDKNVDLSAGFNIFTGERDEKSYKSKGGADNDTMAQYHKPSFFDRLLGTTPVGLLQDGINYPFGLVQETGPKYRLGAGYFGVGNHRFGIDSQKYISHPIQAIGAHYIAKPQPAFLVTSQVTTPYYQCQTRNKFTSW